MKVSSDPLHLKKAARWSIWVMGLGLISLNMAQAQTLAEIWQLVQHNSTHSKLIDATETEAKSNLAQAKSLFKPQVNLSSSIGLADMRNSMQGATFSAPAFSQMGINSVDNAEFKTKASGAIAGQVNLTVMQPLYSPKLNSRKQQIELGAQIASMQSQISKDQLFMTIAQHYYDAALAQEGVRVYQKQLDATAKAQKEAKYRFDIGDSPISGVREAEANYALVNARLLAAQSELTSKRVVLAQQTGLSIDSIETRLPYVDLSNQTESSIDAIIANNVGLKMSKMAEQVAKKQADAEKPWSAVQVSLIGQLSGQYADGRGYGGDGQLSQSDALIGVAADIPLYTGGMQDASYRTAVLGLNKSMLSTDKVRTDLVINAQTLLNQHRALKGQMAALQAATRAAQLRLDATTLGKKVGDNTVLDVLNAQNDLASIELEYAKAAVNLEMVNLTIAMLANRLENKGL